MMKFKFRISKYVKNYKFNSIFIKNLAALFLLIIIPLIGVVTITFYAYDNIQKSEIKAHNEGYITQLSDNIDKIIKEAKSQLIYIGFNPDVELFMYSTPSSENSLYNIKNIYEVIRMPIISKDYISSIYIYSPKIGKVITTEGIANYDNFIDKACIEKYINRKEKSTGQSLLLTDDTRANYKQKQLSVYYDINLGPQNSGIAVMNINLKKLGRISDGVSDHFYITDDSQILFSSNLDEIGQPVGTIEDYNKLLSNKGYIDKRNSVAVKTSADTGLNVISYFNFEIYQEKLIGIRNFMFVFVFGMIIVSVVLCFIISVKIFNPIKKIMSTIEENRAVLLGEDDIFSEQNELKYIVKSIEKTVDKNKNIEDELAERIRLLKKAQSVALQSQINPHFFNNTLETINWMAIGILGSENDISTMASALSNMLRIALENTDTIIPFKDELEHAKLYIEIQKKRYEDKFDIVWNIDNEILDCKTIKIVLQPIIENAIYHGIKPLTNKGIINVRGQVIEDIVRITVTDNGLGISPGEVTELNELMKSEAIKESKHIGLTNVNQRLKLYFGDEYGLEIASKENIETQVTIKLPFTN